jgi:NAD(P)-dependent dehydrogenase (short-subunit alcohol dehydrogenase family)
MTTGFSRDPETSKSRDALEEKLPEMSIPAGRHGEDEEMAGAIQFLSANEYMHGQIVALDGGFMMSEP